MQNNEFKNKEKHEKEEERLQGLLFAYQIVSDQYQHEDNLMEKKNNFFTLINLGILAFLKLMLEEGSQFFPLFIVFCILGVILCIFWYLNSKAGANWLRLRQLEAKDIEERLGIDAVFKREYLLRYENQDISICNENLPSSRYKRGSVFVSKNLPIAFSIVWIYLLIYYYFIN